ncbi:MAG: biotin--[acetyl-CoA-carboxylase] ligase [Nannocystaceae bacterium]
MRSADANEGLDRWIGTRSFGRVHEHHESLTSTNDRAWAWMGEGAPHGALVTAELQTVGRGRRGRVWSSPGGGGDIYASLVLRNVVEAGEGPAKVLRLPGVALAVAVGVRDGITAASEIDPGRIGLKWPNDVQIDGRKVAGVLCESRWQGTRADVVVGIGCNVGRTEFEGNLRDIATSLRLADAGGRLLNRAHVLAEILGGIEAVLPEYLCGGFEAIRARYEPYSVLTGRVVEIDGRGGRVRAVVRGLDANGRLEVHRLDGGQVFVVESGEVSLSGGG